MMVSKCLNKILEPIPRFQDHCGSIAQAFDTFMCKMLSLFPSIVNNKYRDQ